MIHNPDLLSRINKLTEGLMVRERKRRLYSGIKTVMGQKDLVLEGKRRNRM